MAAPLPKYIVHHAVWRLLSEIGYTEEPYDTRIGDQVFFRHDGKIHGLPETLTLDFPTMLRDGSLACDRRVVFELFDHLASAADGAGSLVLRAIKKLDE